MRTIKSGIHVWIITSSLAGFLGGWALLAHSPKPAPANPQPVQIELAPLPTLAPFPSGRSRDGSLQPLPAFPQSRMAAPRLRTGGS